MFPGYSRDTGRKNKYRADPRLKPHAKRIHRAAGVGGNKDYDTELDVFYWVLCALTPVLFKVKLQPPSDRNYATPVQRLANAMASVGPTPIKCHEAAAMALARSMTPRRERTRRWRTPQAAPYPGIARARRRMGTRTGTTGVRRPDAEVVTL
ncbi:hypothetical protein DFH09DRAFT_1098396 [Mycena vulgaris]|nr:hypothetical protein DFH09DRAFT_1098396 [Mycena vulgaris]